MLLHRQCRWSRQSTYGGAFGCGLGGVGGVRSRGVSSEQADPAVKESHQGSTRGTVQQRSSAGQCSSAGQQRSAAGQRGRAAQQGSAAGQYGMTHPAVHGHEHLHRPAALEQGRGQAVLACGAGKRPQSGCMEGVWLRLHASQAAASLAAAAASRAAGSRANAMGWRQLGARQGMRRRAPLTTTPSLQSLQVRRWNTPSRSSASRPSCAGPGPGQGARASGERRGCLRQLLLPACAVS